MLWLGLYAKAQLSVVNVLTFANAVLNGFRWEQFLLEPLIFILWCATAVSLLFWGRGAYCGWLCPFGALQELLNHAARWFGVRQITVPFYLHERLWALKYILFLGIFGVSLGNMAFAEQLAEVEPFKTVVLLHFMREWWFVLFALALLTAGLFIERFYCRYLCVLGAALAIPGRGRMFDWLKRRKQCGYRMPALRQAVHRWRHPSAWPDQSERVHLLHALPGRLLGRPRVPASRHEARGTWQEARRASHSDQRRPRLQQPKTASRLHPDGQLQGENAWLRMKAKASADAIFSEQG